MMYKMLFSYAILVIWESEYMEVYSVHISKIILPASIEDNLFSSGYWSICNKAHYLI